MIAGIQIAKKSTADRSHSARDNQCILGMLKSADLHRKLVGCRIGCAAVNIEAFLPPGAPFKHFIIFFRSFIGEGRRFKNRSVQSMRPLIRVLAATHGTRAKTHFVKVGIISAHFLSPKVTGKVIVVKEHLQFHNKKEKIG